jgi:uncharacterized protein (TIGR03435 family)
MVFSSVLVDHIQVKILHLPLLLVPLVHGQEPQLPKFEVAAVHSAGPRPADLQQWLPSAAENSATLQDLRAGRIHREGEIRLRDVPMRKFLNLAFEEIFDDEYLKGAPGWIDTARFDLTATVVPGTSAAAERLMIQSLLIDRFGLSFHRELVTKHVLMLFAGTNGLRMEAGSTGELPSCGLKVELDFKPPHEHAICKNAPMSLLAQYLSSMSNLGHVVDKTELPGTFDFDMEWVRPEPDVDGGPGKVVGISPEAKLQAIGSAVSKQLGLRLVGRTESMPIIMVDHLNRTPTDN